MTRRRGSAALALGPAVMCAAVAALLLGGCAPGAEPSAAPSAGGSPTPTATPSADAEPPGIVVPGDAVLAIAATATADNGAVLDLLLVAHPPVAWDSPEAAEATAAILAACPGEVDASVLSAGAYRIAPLDVTATPRPGAIWPADLPLVLLPAAADGIVLTATDGAAQYAPPGQDGDSVPHCRQTGLLPGPGSGTLLVGFDGGRGWPAALFGFGPQELAGVPTPERIAFADCRVALSDAGPALVGAATLPDPASEGSCAATTTGS